MQFICIKLKICNNEQYVLKVTSYVMGPTIRNPRELTGTEKLKMGTEGGRDQRRDMGTAKGLSNSTS